MFFATKQKALEAQLGVYRQRAAACVEQVRASIKAYCASSDLQQLRQDMHAIHRIESEADDIRREIEVLMYSRALFPESREDILNLLETMDRVPGQAENAVRSIANQMIEVPAFLHADLCLLLDTTHRCVTTMFECVEKMFNDFQNATALVGKVDAIESEVDAMQSRLIQQIFASDIRDMAKILLRDLVNEIASISDYAEEVSDLVRIMVAKRLT